MRSIFRVGGGGGRHFGAPPETPSLRCGVSTSPEGGGAEESARHDDVSDLRNSSRNTGKISAGLEILLVAKLGHASATVR
jgi:hypothetical protein